MDQAAPSAAGDLAPEMAARQAALEVLEARHRTADYSLGFDDSGFHAWSIDHRRTDRPDLDAATAKELDGLLDAVLVLPGWLYSHPGAEVHVEDSHCHGSYPLGRGTRLWTGPVPRSDLTAAMRVLAERAAGCGRLEQEFPGWIAGVSPQGEWMALHTEGGKLKGADEDELRGNLRTATGGRTWPA